MAQPLVFDFYNSIIEVSSPDTSLDMQYLIDQIRDTEDELNPGLAFGQIASASGKDALGGGIYTAITVRLLDNWRIRFEARSGPGTEQMTVGGGNLVGGPGGNPYAPSAFTQVIALSSAAGTIATPTTSNDSTNIKYLLASMGAIQKGVGDIFYWDPVSGSDAHTGLTPDASVATFSHAQSLTTTGNHDIIFCLSSDPSGITTITETITITKNTLKVKGPGHVFQFAPTVSGSDSVVISANDVELSGLYISTAGSGSDNAVTVTGDNIFINDCWIGTATGNGIDISSSNLTKIDKCVVENAANGINLGAGTTKASITQCIINDNTNGIHLAGSGTNDNIIDNCIVYSNSGYGIDISASSVDRTTVRGGNTFSNNATANTHDAGTNTYIETGGTVTQTDIDNIASGVWDEVIAGHTTVGTTGKTLKDAKTKATLASLK
ncbi:hypothetical protein BH10PAT1_BH10PAT1_1080 [soil metagenome]